jgi:ATP-dependent DNA helicase RecG
MSDLKTFLKTTPRYIELLEQAGIKTIKDFLEYFPRTYEQRDAVKTLELPIDESSTMTFRALVISKKVTPRPGGKQYAEITCQDPLGNQAIIYLRQINYQRSVYEPNKRYLITGKPKRIGRKITFWHPNAVSTTAPVAGLSNEIES